MSRISPGIGGKKRASLADAILWRPLPLLQLLDGWATAFSLHPKLHGVQVIQISQVRFARTLPALPILGYKVQTLPSREATGAHLK